MTADESVGTDLVRLRSEWQKACRAWNADGGPLEKTVKADEDLYFAALFLIEHLEERSPDRS